MKIKQSILATLLAAASISAYAGPAYYVVVPVPGREAGIITKINVALSGTPLPSALVGTPYAGFDFNQALAVTGDRGYTGYGVQWSLSSGSLPAGLTLGRDGTISGTPTASGTASFQVKATYKTKSGEQAYQIIVAKITVALAAGTPPQAKVGQVYAFDLKPLLTVSGDSAYSGTGVTWSVVSSTLPDGLTLRADGNIAGTPTSAGTGSITARATYKGSNGEQTYQIVTVNIQVTLTAAKLPDAKVGTSYAVFDFKNQLSVQGDAAYDAKNATFAATGLPTGMSLSTDGLLTGTPAKKNSMGASFNVVATYKTQTGQQTYSVVVNGQPLAVSQLAAGGFSTCAVTPAGGLKCWGYNGAGQLGNGTNTDSLDPVDVVGLTSGVASISAGWQHFCALTTAGGVKCWGTGADGRLGNGNTTNSNVPVAVSGLSSGVASLGLGYYHSCAVTTSGSARCWGPNGNGQLGNNTMDASSVPVAVSGLSSGVASIGGGEAHTCARTTGGAVKCWGYNGNGGAGTLGNGSNANYNSLVPAAVSGLSGVTSLSVGGFHTCVLVSSTVKCWGDNEFGQLGNNTTTHAPTPVTITSGVAQLALGKSYSCARTTAGAVQCWGSNSNGQLGDGTTTNRLAPSTVPSLTSGVTALTAGSIAHTCAVSGNGLCWGYNGNGQLGSHGTTQQLAPVIVEAP